MKRIRVAAEQATRKQPRSGLRPAAGYAPFDGVGEATRKQRAAWGCFILCAWCQALGRRMAVLLNAVLVANHQPVELVNELVDCSV